MTTQNIKPYLAAPRFTGGASERRLRLAQIGDVPVLQELVDQAVRRLGSRDYTLQQIESSLKYIFGVDTQLIADGTYYVVEIDGQIAGAGGWSRRKTLYGGDQTKFETEGSLLDPISDPAKIRAFYVHPNWARRGIGRQIMLACETAAREAGFSRLELMATLTGQPLYAACGFRVVEPGKIEMPDGVKLPVVKMAKRLN